MLKTVRLVQEPHWRTFYPIGTASPKRWSYVKQYAMTNSELIRLFLSPLNSNRMEAAVAFCEARHNEILPKLSPMPGDSSHRLDRLSFAAIGRTFWHFRFKPNIRRIDSGHVFEYKSLLSIPKPRDPVLCYFVKVKLNISFTPNGASPCFTGTTDSEINNKVQKARMRTGRLSDSELESLNE